MERIDLNSLYTERWFRLRPKLNWRTEHFCKAVWQVLGPFKTYVDLGCAIGEYVAYFRHVHNVLAVGFDGSENCLTHMAPGANVCIYDLRAPIEWADEPRFDVCTCLEVAEHIEPEYSDVLVGNCCALSDLILFTAAKPGQEGLGHVNLQPQSYWIKKFTDHQYTFRSDLTKRFIALLEPWKHKKGLKAYYENAMVFEKWI